MQAIRKSSLHRLSLLVAVLSAASMLTCDLQDLLAVSQEEQSDELFAFPPRTPERLIRAAVLANQLDRPVLAKQYLATFLETLPGRETLNALRKDIGISVFLKLSSTITLHPESPKVLAAINEAYPYPELSPSSIASLVDSLGQSADITTSASLQILSSGADAVVPLLNADPNSESGRIAHLLLSRYAGRFVDGLIGALEASDLENQARILGYLAATGNKDLCFHVLPLQYSDDRSVAVAAENALRDMKASEYIGITRFDAARVLSNQSVASLNAATKHHQNGTKPDEADITGANSADENNPPHHLQTALRLATQAVSVDDSLTAQSVKLAVESALNAWPAMWPDVSSQLTMSSTSTRDDKVTARAVEVALDAQCAAPLLQLLKDFPQTSQLLDDYPSLKQKCLTFHDPRVRLLTAASLWNEEHPSERVQNIVKSVIDGSKRPQAVVIDPRVQDGSDAVRVLRELGYSVDFERTGREGFSKAAKQLQCELVLVHSNCLQWPLSLTLTNLRADYRTANVPIVIYGPESHRRNVVSKLNSDPSLWFESEPLGVKTTGKSMQLQNVATPRLTEEERVKMIRFALRLANAN